MKRILILLVFISTHTFVLAQRTDKKLQQQLEALVKDFKGDIGVYVKDLRTNKTVQINADTVFPTASMVKVPILIGVMDKINRGELGYHQPLTYRDSLLYAGVDILGSFKQDEKIELSKVMMLMLTMSDNTASLWLQSLAGTGTRINQLMDSLGLVYTRVNSRTPGREAIRSVYGWGQSSPREMATLFEKIYKGEVVSRAASDKMLRLLNRNYFDIVAVSQVPPNATVYTKYGAVDQTRNEVLLVKGDKAEYVFCIMSKNNKDESWQNNNEAWELTRKISRLLWNYYEPKDNWVPASDAAKFD
ncbi:MAG TPA: serine hydrolase [Flavisolibacter sp.]|nr:serine hydrolase [Flavisolibacter sp.]